MSRRPRTATRNAPRKSRRLILLSGLALAVGLGWLVVEAVRTIPPPDRRAVMRTARPPDPARTYAAYGGSESCRECHEENFKAWESSNHRFAERAPSAAMDDPAFTPVRAFKHGSQNTTLLTDNGHPEIITAGPYVTNEIFVVSRVLGNFPLRQMLIEFPGKRLQATEAAWDPRSNEWFNVYGDEDRTPGEWGHWTGRGMNWNSMCAGCHNTRLRKNYDVANDSFGTARAEMGVGCEACHGPMKDHTQWQFAHRGKNVIDPTPRRLTRDQMFDTCAACHSRRAEITGDPQPGDSYWDHHLLSIVDDSNLFYPDGQIRDEDYEVAPFLGSRMFHKGVRCLDCHDAHSQRTRLPGNLLCLSCHSPGMTNAPTINPAEHSHHKVFGSDTKGNLVESEVSAYEPAGIKETGGQCVNCHMPQTAYMQRHRRHDHGFTIPDPLLTKQFGIPNACSRCHADKTVDWSLEYAEKWYGDKLDRPYRQRAQVMARARQGDDGALEPLIKLLDPEQIPYWRAVAVGLLEHWAGDPRVTATLVRELRHNHPLVRQMAAHALGPLVQQGRAEIAALLGQGLQDLSRNVRIEVARELAATLDTNSLAGVEYLGFLERVADQPTGQLQAGLFALARGDPTNALIRFQTAVRWDPGSGALRHELAIVLSQLGRPREAVKELEEAVRLAPEEGEFHYKLALALNEAGEPDRVVPELELAVKLEPRHARAWYNLGLARSGGGDESGALEALVRAESVATSDPGIPYARATVLVRVGRLQEARAAARRALELDPNNADAIALLQQISRQ